MKKQKELLQVCTKNRIEMEKRGQAMINGFQPFQRFAMLCNKVQAFLIIFLCQGAESSWKFINNSRT